MPGPIARLVARLVEAAGFAALALAGHLVVLGDLGPDLGGSAAGAPGLAPVQIAVADDALRALVERWDAPPAVDTPVEPAPAPLETAFVPPAASMVPAQATRGRSPDFPEIPPLAAPEIARAAPPDRPVAAVAAPRRRPDDLAPPRRAAPPPDQTAARQVAVPGTSTARGRGAEAAPVRTGAERDRLDRSYGEIVRAEIARRRTYPAAAQARGQTGRVTLRVTLSTSGALLEAAVVRSSGKALLDRAGLDAVARVGRFPAAPGGLGRGQFTYVLPLDFELH